MGAFKRLTGILLLGAVLAHPGGAAARAADAPPRSAGLAKAWRNPQAARTVFFVHGMSCRACTMLLDRRMATTEGIHWSRFNYPLRLLVVYHDQRLVSTGALREMVSQGELRAEMSESYPASGYYPDRRVRVATWTGVGITLEEARGIPGPFHASLKQNLLEPDDPEYSQVISEIVGEEVRRRILAERAAAAGFRGGPVDTVLPTVLAREFYYPQSAMKPTPTEAGIALFLKEKVLLGDEGQKGRERYDGWLRDLWKEVRLDFRPEYLEAGPQL